MKTTTRKTLTTIALIGLGLGLAGAGYAGPFGGRGGCANAESAGMYQPMGGGMMGGMHQGRMGGMGMAGMRGPGIDLEQVRAALNLQPEQQAAWDRFATAHAQRQENRQAQRQAMMAQRDTMMNGDISYEDRQALREARMAGMQAQREQALADRQALFEALTPEQRAIAERMLAPRGGMRAF